MKTHWKPDLESMLAAVGWTGESANAPGCINPGEKCLMSAPDHVLPLGQPWDRDGTPPRHHTSLWYCSAPLCEAALSGQVVLLYTISP